MKIKKNNILSLDRYINNALYDGKAGYYNKKNPFGEKGDYITSPNISVLFSEMIAIWIISFWQSLKCPKKFNLIELGAGNGEMTYQILQTFNNFPQFKKCCKLNILEKSTFLKKIQKQKLKNNNIKWLKDIDEITDIPNIFIANEFFDALPIKQFYKKNNKWFEKYVEFKNLNKPKFKNIESNIEKLEKKIGYKISHNQNFIEYSPLSIKYFKLISKKIKSNNGGILIIDYGYWDRKMKNTLQSIYKHKYNNILDNFGKADITYHINFNLVENFFKKFDLQIGGKNNQGTFLKNLGILERAEIISKNLPFSKKADIYYRVKRLIDKDAMGNLFKVLFVTTKRTFFKTGFVN